MSKRIIIDLKEIYIKKNLAKAKISHLYQYVQKALELAGEGNEVVLTGAAPIWMYLKIAHALHGKARKLFYSAPGQGIKELEIFSHDPF